MTIRACLTALTGAALLAGLGGCATFSTPAPAPAATTAPAAPAVMIKRAGAVRGPAGAAIPQGSTLTLRVYDAALADANSEAAVVTLRNPPPVWPWAASIDIPQAALARLSRPALGAVVKGPDESLLYINDTAYLLPAEGAFDLPVVKAGF